MAAVRRLRSRVSITRAPIGWGPRPAAFAPRSWRRARYDAEMVSPRALMRTCMAEGSALLGRHPALVRGEDAQLLSVLGHRAARGGESLGVQRLGDVLV